MIPDRLFHSDRRDLTVIRAYYFAYIGGVGFISPFLNLFYVSLGLNGKQIGIFASISAVVGLLIAPMWVQEVRKSRSPRAFMQLAIAINAMAYILISNQVAFLPIAVIVFFQALAAAGVAPMSDSLAVKVARTAGTGYGTVRVMGSLGWIFTVLSSGWLIQHLGFKVGFAATGLAYVLSASLLFFVGPDPFTTQVVAGPPKAGLGIAIKRVLGDRVLWGFALALIFIGFLNNGVTQFENVYLAQLGASKSVISVAGIMSALVELPCMILSDRVMRRFGPHRLLMAALVMYVLLRATVLALPAILTIIVVRFATGLCFSMYTVSFVGLITSRTPAEETGTVLALYSITLAGSVNIVASPLTGAAFDALGGRWLYAFAMAGYVAAFASLWATRPKPDAEQTNPAQAISAGAAMEAGAEGSPRTTD